MSIHQLFKYVFDVRVGYSVLVELDDPFFTCSCCAEDDDSLKLPKTLGIEPSDLSRFTIGADSSKSLNQYTGESQEIDGGNLWMGMNWY